MNILEFALKVIKDEYAVTYDCSECRLRLNNKGVCAITHNVPDDWELKREQEECKKDSLFSESED